MSKEAPIKCAVIGLGRIGSTLEFDRLREKPASHTGAIHAHPECEIAAGCDEDPQKLEAFQKAWVCNNLYNDYSRMLDECKIDILHIATPPETHREILRCALERGVPVIVCEKPLAATLDDAEKMARMAKKSRSKIVINHERRYALNYQHARRMIDSQKYGRTVSIIAKVYMGYRSKAGDVLLDDGTHMVDLLRFLTGCKLKVHHVMGNPSSASAPLAAVIAAGDITVLFEVGPGRDHIVFEVDISFERGRVLVGNGVYEEYESSESPFYEKMKSLKQIDVSFGRTEYFKRMFDDAVALFKGEKEVPESSIEDGLEAMRVIDEMVKKSSKY